MRSKAARAEAAICPGAPEGTSSAASTSTGGAMTEPTAAQRSWPSQSARVSRPRRRPSSSTTQTASWLRRSNRCSASSTGALGPTVNGVSNTGWAAFTREVTPAITSGSTSCGRMPRPPRRAMVSTMRRPVTAVMFAATSGTVVPVPSSVEMSTSMREVTEEREGTRKTSE